MKGGVNDRTFQVRDREGGPRGRVVFSRRNKTRESHLDSKAMREEKLLKKQEDAKTRARSAVNRSAQEQLFILDYRLGEGLGAVKERARLTAFI